MNLFIDIKKGEAIASPFVYYRLILPYALPAAAEKQSTIDEKRKPCYILGGIRGQEEHCVGNILRFPQTTHRYPLTERIEDVASNEQSGFLCNRERFNFSPITPFS